MADRLRKPIKFTDSDYKLFNKVDKEHILTEIINGVIQSDPNNIAGALEDIFLKEPFLSDTLKKMFEYMYYIPLEDIPLYINNNNSYYKSIIKWRLKVGK